MATDSTVNGQTPDAGAIKAIRRALLSHATRAQRDTAQAPISATSAPGDPFRLGIVADGRAPTRLLAPVAPPADLVPLRPFAWPDLMQFRIAPPFPIWTFAPLGRSAPGRTEVEYIDPARGHGLLRSVSTTYEPVTSASLELGTVLAPPAGRLMTVDAELIGTIRTYCDPWDAPWPYHFMKAEHSVTLELWEWDPAGPRGRKLRRLRFDTVSATGLSSRQTNDATAGTIKVFPVEGQDPRAHLSITTTAAPGMQYLALLRLTVDVFAGAGWCELSVEVTPAA